MSLGNHIWTFCEEFVLLRFWRYSLRVLLVAQSAYGPKLNEPYRTQSRITNETMVAGRNAISSSNGRVTAPVHDTVCLHQGLQ